MDFIGKSYYRGVIFSFIFVTVIMLIMVARKLLVGTSDWGQISWDMFVYQLDTIKWFYLFAYVGCLFLVSAKVMGRRIADS